MSAKTKIAGLMVVLMALTVPMVYADNGGASPMSGGDTPHHQMGDWHHGQQDHILAKILNLSDDQVKQLKDSKEKQKATMKSIFDQMKSNREAFDAEIVKAAPDMNKINDIQAQLKTIQSQMVDARLNSILEIKKIMTPEQFAGYMALEKAKKLMMHKGHHEFGRKDDSCKAGDGHKHWGDKSGEDHSSDAQD